jgi:hypothetical protein
MLLYITETDLYIFAVIQNSDKRMNKSHTS